jgi:hypothetical protein
MDNRFNNLRSLAKMDLTITNLKIDLEELKADKRANVLTELLIKKKMADMAIEIHQRNEFVKTYKLNLDL